MARTVETITQSFISTLESIDPSVDVRKGPIFDLFIRPVANELAFAEERAEHLARLYSLQFADEATDEEVNALATDLGAGRSEGRPANTRQIFFTFTRPATGQIITVDAGTLVSTSDNSITFRVVESVTIDGGIADAFFNASKRRYEVATTVEAVSVGTDFEVAAFRLTRLLTTVDGIDGTENISPAEGGQEAETKDDLVNRLKQQILGFERGTTGGIVSTVVNLDPVSVLAVAFLSSADHELFERSISDPALDIYVIGTITEIADQTYISFAGDTTIVLENQPATGIQSLSVNGTAVGFDFIEDTETERRGSVNSQNAAVLDSPLALNDVVLIEYTHNRLIRDIQEAFTSTQLFGTNTLIRTPIEILIDIQVEITILSSFSESRVVEQVQAVILDYTEPDTFPGLLLPETLRERILEQVAGVSRVIISRFTRTYVGTLEVEVIQLERHQQSSINNLSDIIVVRQ